MTDFVQIGDATLYHGDCLDTLQILECEACQAIITDPPYGLPGEESIDVFNKVIESCNYRIGAVFLDWRNPLKQTDKFGELIWEYGWVSGARTKKNNGVNHTHNTIHLFGDESLCDFSDGSVIHRKAGFNSPRHCSSVEKTGHPYEKPVALMQWILSRMQVHSVMDPFMGSGTTGVACATFGIKFIGIEIERKYFDIACERIEAAYAQGRLFA